MLVRILFPALAVCVLLVGGMACTPEDREVAGAPSSEAEEIELALHMAHLQRWTHKAILALRARSPELADFYLHEMDETIETIQEEVPTYEGHKVGALTKKTLVPSVEALEEALDDREWATVEDRIRAVEAACNQCHSTTEHGFVHVDLQSTANPYAQDFSPESP